MELISVADQFPACAQHGSLWIVHFDLELATILLRQKWPCANGCAYQPDENSNEMRHYAFNPSRFPGAKCARFAWYTPYSPCRKHIANWRMNSARSLIAG